MSNILIAVPHNFGKIDEVIVPGNVFDRTDRRFPLADFDAAYAVASASEASSAQHIDLSQLRVHVEGQPADVWSYASARSKWDAETGRYKITSISNSHGGYDYANLLGR